MILSVIIAFIVCLGMGPVVIPLLRRLKLGQNIRDDGPQSHLEKSGTPTMGGVMILAAMIIPCVIFANGSYDFILFSVAVTLGFGLIGLMDDSIKVIRKRSMGLRAYQKIIGQFLLALLIAIYCYTSPQIGSKLWVPFFNVEWDLGWFYIPFTMFVVIAVVNSVNLIDGLDGLASSTTTVYSAAFAIVFIYASQKLFAQGDVLLSINYNNMSIFSAAVAGACLGFLRYNTFPAKVFMGDTGALALGSAVCIMAVVMRATLIIPVMGGLYVLTALSVVLQVGSFKLRKGKRVFKMAPLHHHFELKGVPETKIVGIYTIVAILLALIGLLAFI